MPDAIEQATPGALVLKLVAALAWSVGRLEGIDLETGPIEVSYPREILTEAMALLTRTDPAPQP